MDKRKIRIAILAISSVIMGSTIISAILADISIYYSNMKLSVIQMILTLPFLLGTILSLISGPLSKRISKKKLVVFAIFSGLSGGSLAFLFGGVSIYILIVSSGLIGIGQGMISTLSMALIADYFEGEERSSLMGLQSAFVNFGGMVMIFISGLLASINWGYSYLVYIVFIPILLLVINNLPKDEALKEAVTSSNKKDKLNSTVYFSCLTVLFFGLFMYVFQTNVALFMSVNNLGDSTLSGMANSLFVAVGGVTGIIYIQINRLLKTLMIPVGIIVTAIGLISVFIFGNLASVFIAAICGGFGLTLIVPTAIFNVSVAVKPELSAVAIALVNSGINIGIFLSPLIVNMLSGFISNEDISIRFLVGAIGLIVLLLVYMLLNAKIVGKKNEVTNA